MSATIFRPAKTAMQSGKANTEEWILEFDAETARVIEPLMGYTASADTRQQLRLRFSTREAAEAYCRRNGILYRVRVPQDPRRRRVSYADNFAYDRKTPWTH